MNYVNLTPHNINVVLKSTPNVIEEEELKPFIIRTIPKSGKVARVQVKTEQATEVIPCDFEVVKNVYDEVEGLPRPKDFDVMYIVSILTQQALKAKDINRIDVITPDTGPDSVIRNKNGDIIGVRRFQVI